MDSRLLRGLIVRRSHLQCSEPTGHTSRSVSVFAIVAILSPAFAETRCKEF